ncbi:MFS transporter [Legionella sp. D16C41]|uniref:MFS transporter n=1 Tax=Legionella sp. D16C41 TaxID=3402688 RepID=UPI003AF8629C
MKLSAANKALIAGILGTVLQWYDFALLGYFSPVIAQTYFPGNNHFISLLSTFGVLAVGYLLAPLGSLVFGYLGDYYGRKRALTISILAMAIPTALISIIPSYNTLGLVAPLLITLLRMMQGFVAGAEFSGSTIFLVEHAKSDKKAFYGSLTSSAYSIGSMLAGLAASFFTASFMPVWGWRLAYAIALVAGLLIFFLRQYVSESPEFQILAKHEKLKKPFLTALKEKPLAMIGVMGLAWLVGIMTFGTYVFMTTYLTTYFGLPLSLVSIIIICALALDALLEPFIALFADKVGHIQVSIIGIISMAFLSIPIFYFIATGSVGNITRGLLLMSVLIALTYAPLNAYMVSLFPKQYRYSGFGVAYHLGLSIFGGTAPMVMLWLIHKSNNLLAPALYYVIGAFIGLNAIALCERSKRQQSNLQLINQSEVTY